MYEVQQIYERWTGSDEMFRERKHALRYMCKRERHYLQHLQTEPASYKLFDIHTKSICNDTLPRLFGSLLGMPDTMHNGSDVRYRHKFMLEVL